MYEVSDIYIIFNHDEIAFDVHVICALSSDTVLVKWFDATVRCMVPFILMLAGNISIVYKIHGSNRNRKHMISDESVKVYGKCLKSITYMLLTASFTYLFLTLPYAMKIFICEYTRIFYETVDEFQSAEYLWSAISFCLMYLNNSLNYLLYCISGKTFKEEFLVMCGCHKRLTGREKVIELANKDHAGKLKESVKNNQMEEQLNKIPYLEDIYTDSYILEDVCTFTETERY